MIELKLHKAIVIDDNDTDKLSRVKIRILPEFKDVPKNLLPWALPFNHLMGMSGNTFSHNPPVEDSHIWVFFLDKYWKKPYYITGRMIEGLFNYDEWDNIESDIDEINSASYPNPRFFLLEGGSILFYNTFTKDIGIYHSTKSYAFIKGNGEIYINSKTKKMLLENNNGSIEIGTNGTIDINNGNLTVSA